MTAMLGTTLVMTSLDHAPIAGEKMGLQGFPTTSSSFASQLHSGMAGTPILKERFVWADE
jgi:hypothetical protein